eukprot:11477612-Alexandrium_andersonii.AAC.1
MSASLVGSEMCIRDSQSALRARPPNTSAQRLCYYACSTLPLASSSLTATCLLYTSDAADDM